MGSTRPGSNPPAATTSRAKWYQVRGALVGDVEEARPPRRPESQDHAGQVAGEGRAAPLVVHEPQRTRLAANRSTVLTMLAPCGPHTQEVRTMAAPGQPAETSCSPPSLLRP